MCTWLCSSPETARRLHLIDVDLTTEVGEGKKEVEYKITEEKFLHVTI